MEAHSVTEIAEEALCRQLFIDPTFSQPLLRELRVEATSLLALSTPTTRIAPNAKGPGDIDVLISATPHHENALAIEVKRVKVGAEAFHTGMPGKLQNLRRGVQQANLLAQLQFSRAMLLIVVVTDGRERDGLNFAFRGAETRALRQAIDGFPGREKLAPKVGLAFVELTQPIDKDIADAGGIGIRIARPPTMVTQPESLSSAVRALFKQGAC